MVKLPAILAITTLWLAAVAAFTAPRIHPVGVKSGAALPLITRRHAFRRTNLSSSTSSIETNQQGNQFIQEARRLRQERQQHNRDKSTLRFMYAAATGLCIQMATEIVISPGNLLPGALWAALVPFQLHPTFRRTHPKTYKAMGLAWFGAAASMAFGLFNLLQGGADGIVEATLPSIATNSNLLLCSWFVYTGAKAFQLALRGKSESLLSRSDYAQRRWMLRHIGSGLWIALQRMFGWAILGTWSLSPPEGQRFLSLAARAGAVATIGAAEYAVTVFDRYKHGFRGETVDFEN